jgi:hypothetical protein
MRVLWWLSGAISLGACLLSAEDCNRNHREDGLEIADGSSMDCNSNGVPDECEIVGELAFREPREFLLGGDPSALATADLDEDGDLDLASASAGDPSQVMGVVSILLNRGDGSFDPPRIFYTGRNPQALAAGDFDGDGRADLISASSSSDTPWILYNEGNARLPRAEPMDLGFPVPGITSVVAPDLNEDGRLDLAVSHGDGVAVSLNEGARHLAQARRYKAGDMFQELIAADLDGNGNVDLCALNSTQPTLSVLLNRGDGTFEEILDILTLNQTQSLSAADLDGDGAVDLAAILNDSAALFLNQGDVFASRKVLYAPLAPNPSRIVLSDLEGDGDVDIVGSASNAVCALRNEGKGTFAKVETYPGHAFGFSMISAALRHGAPPAIVVAGSFARIYVYEPEEGGALVETGQYATGEDMGALLTEDLDQDSSPDLAFSSGGTLALSWNEGDGDFAKPEYYAVDFAAAEPILADLNGDGLTDLVGDSYVLFNEGGRKFQRAQSFERGSVSLAVDLDRDGDVDLVGSRSNQLFVLTNQGDGTLSEASLVPGRAIKLVAADLDLDGEIDLAGFAREAETGPWELSTWRNEGHGEFRTRTVVANAKGFVQTLLVEDLDIDHYPDLAVLYASIENAVVYWSDGGRAYSSTSSLLVGPGPMMLVAADLNADDVVDLAATQRGRIDLEAGVQTDSGVVVLWNRAERRFDRAELRLDPIPAAVLVDDLDRNGLPDLIVTNIECLPTECPWSISAFLNQGAERFGAPFTAPVDRQPLRIVTPDVNGDEWPDVVTGNGNSSFSVLLNATRPQASNDVNRNHVPDECEPRVFQRGDSNGDGKVDLSDAVTTLGFLFVGTGNPTCLDAADADDSGRVEITDAIFLLGALFLGTNVIPPPHPDCGADPTAQDALGCGQGCR